MEESQVVEENLNKYNFKTSGKQGLGKMKMIHKYQEKQTKNENNT